MIPARTDGGLADTAGPVVVVGDEAAIGVAVYLDDEHQVRLLSNDPAVVRTGTSRGIDARLVELDDGGRLREHVEDVASAVVATDRDRSNLLVAQLLRTVGSVDHVVVIVNDPRFLEVFEDVEIEAIHGSSLVGPSIGDTLGDAGE